MGPKSKPTKNDWVKCSKCTIIFLSKQKVLHDEVCMNEAANTNVKDVYDFIHNFSKDLCSVNDLIPPCSDGSVLLGTFLPLTGEIEGFSNKRPENLVLLHCETIKLLGLSIGASAILQNLLEVTIWPDNKLPLETIGIDDLLIQKLSLAKEDAVVVRRFEGSILNASVIELYLEINSNCYHKDQLLKLLQTYLDEKVFTAGNQIHMSFLGKPVELVVTKVVGVNLSESNLRKNYKLLPTRKKISSEDLDDSVQNISDVITTEDLTQSLLDLSISDNFSNSFMSPSPAKESKKKVQEQNIKVNISRLKFINEYAYDLSFFRVNKNTVIHFVTKDNFDSLQIHNDKDVENEGLSHLSTVSGYKSQVQKIKEIFDCALKFVNNHFHTLQVSKGILLYGPSGCGKTLMAKSFIKNYNLNFVTISGPDIWSKFHGQSEQNLKSLFNEAKLKVPCVILLDELETLCPKRENTQSDVEKRVVSTFTALLDDAVNEDNIIILATSSRRDDIDQSVRRPGRLDREIEIGVPNIDDRFEILKGMLAQVTHSLQETDILEAARNAHGFVGADLAAVIREAGLSAITRRSESDTVLTGDDLIHGLQSVQPSAMREVAIEVPNVKWDDIGGQKELKHKLRQAIEWPLKHPDAFKRLGIRPPKGLLMYGPPGCSKTMIAKALATESGINFIAIKGAELLSKWVGESERAVRETFRKARAAAPAIIFFDEVDALAGERSSGGGGDVSDRVLAQLLTEIDGVEALEDVTVVAATNRPDRIDKALLRPGRLDRIVYVSLPNNETRKEIFTIQFRKTPVAEDVDIEHLIACTERYSGAEVSAVCHEAALNAMQEDINILQVHARHFESAIKQVQPRITDELLNFYDLYAGSSGLHSI